MSDHFASIPPYVFTAEVAIAIIDFHRQPRLAASSYLNSAPLIWSLSHGPLRNEVSMVDAVPAQCADLLAAEAVDFALVPVIEYQRIPNVKLVKDVCVGSRKEVRSVVLASRLNDLKQVRTVALDESSRTSATLVKVVFKEFLGLEPKWTTTSPNIHEMLSQNDAALIIGDPGMLFEREQLHIWDMAALWKENTGFGFVFAMWMGLENAIDVPAFAAARDDGLTKIEEIVSFYQHLTRMPAIEIRNYLNQNIVFQIDEDLNNGMNLYFQLAHKHGLIPDQKPLSFIREARSID